MKKLILLLFLGGFVFTACQKDDLNSVTELDAVEGRGNNGEIKNNEENGDDEFCIPDLMPSLPAEAVQICVTDKGEGIPEFPDAATDTPSYFDITVGGTFFNAWCADQDTSLDVSEVIPDDCIEAHLYSSYDPFLLTQKGPGAGQFEFPENFDLVNYVLNTYTPGMNGITQGDIQKAIWDLIDDSNCVVCDFAKPFTQANIDAIVADAIANGQDYTPGEGGVLAIVAIPKLGSGGEEYQSLIFTIPVECRDDCETAFAYDEEDATCFDNFDFSRWGWTIGPLSTGEYTFDVYSGAGQCDLDKGTLVGEVDVTYSASGVTVDYRIDPMYSIAEEHTYAGVDPIPTKNNGDLTVAPGQYYIEEGLDGSDDIYLILHTVVCENDDNGPE